MLTTRGFVMSLSIIYLTLVTCAKAKKTDFEIVKDLVEDHALEKAEKYLNSEPITVTENISERSSGSKHDFYSEGDYWWPDPENPDGAYIRKDGLTNPNNFVAHRRVMIRLSQISGALASAYLVTNNKKYLDNLIPHLKAWFINKSTKMNPNLLYAQAIKGRVTGRGIGIIDTVHLIEVALAVKVIEQSGLYPASEIDVIKNWFSQYLKWLTTHEYGLKERDHGNNHSTCWVMQVAAFAKLVGDQDQLEQCKIRFKDNLLPNQMADNGSFPKELDRTKPYGYSIFNLDAFAGIAQLLSTQEENLFEYKTSKGKSVKLGLTFLYPFLKDKSKWTYKEDVMFWDDWPTKQPALLFGGLQLDKKHFIQTWKALPEIPEKPEIIRNMPVRNPVLWIVN